LNECGCTRPQLPSILLELFLRDLIFSERDYQNGSNTMVDIESDIGTPTNSMSTASCFVYRVLSIVPLILVLTATGNSQTITYDRHPCHFIILVDASRSTQSRATKTNYEKALREVLPTLLYEKGFGQSIPVFDPKQDVLTLLTFGVVIRSETPAYLDLRNYDLSTQFIHPLILRRSNVESSDLNHQIVPHTYYEITALSWAKQLALWSLQGQLSSSTNHRTFLIAVNDGVANENSLTAELTLIEQWGEADNIKKTHEIVSRTNDDYRFVNPHVDKVPAGEEKKYHSVFIESYEIKSKSQLEWEAEAKRFKPFKNLEFSWTKESGIQPVGNLHTEVQDQFIAWLRSSQTDGGQLSLAHGGKLSTTSWTLDPAANLSVVIEGNLSCEQESYEAALEIPVIRHDVLGAATGRLKYTQPVTTPLPVSCTRSFIFWWSVKGLLIVIGLGVIAYLVFYRLFTTHIKLELPGLAIKIRVERTGKIERNTPVPPANGLAAFSLLLPKKWVQAIFYRQATITIHEVGNLKLDLPETFDKLSLRFPINQTSLSVIWNEAPRMPAELKLIFKHGRQHSEVKLFYPKGV
jgi:hypothetical protein